MSEPHDYEPIREYTPEEMKRICDEQKKFFTADDLYGYIEDTDEKFPMEQVLAEAEEMIREARARREGKAG